MRSIPSHRRGRSLFRILSLPIVVLLVGVATVYTLWMLGIVEWAKKAKADAPATAQELGGMKIPISNQRIPAYTRLGREHVIDPKSGEVTAAYYPPDKVKLLGYLTGEELGQLMNKGRVLNREVPPGFPFKEDYFFPEGTRAGPVAGVPLGKRAFVLPVEKIQGIHLLRRGDHFDLLGTVPVDFEKTVGKYQTAGSPDLMMASRIASWPKRGSVHVLVQNGTVVLPVTTREVPITSASQARGGPPQTRPVQEITIAIDPEEVAKVTEALTIHADVMCVARSGRPVKEGEKDKDTPGSNPGPALRTMESIVGNRRQVLVFTKEGEPPQVVNPEPSPGEIPPPKESEPIKPAHGAEKSVPLDRSPGINMPTQ